MKEGKMASLDTLQPAIARIQGAIRQFANGDSEPYKACWSQAADVTIYGGWGAYERGWVQVEPRLEWAAARWRGCICVLMVCALEMSFM
jgi:hypothetical protein